MEASNEIERSIRLTLRNAKNDHELQLLIIISLSIRLVSAAEFTVTTFRPSSVSFWWPERKKSELIRKKVQATGLDRPLRSSLLFVFPKSKSFFKCRASFQNCKTNFHSFIIFCCVNFSADFFRWNKRRKSSPTGYLKHSQVQGYSEKHFVTNKIAFLLAQCGHIRRFKTSLKFIYKPCFRKIRKPLESLSKL